MLQRILIITTILISLFASAGYFVVFKMKQWHIHERIEILIENLTNERELHRLEISLNEAKNLKWERAGKEFWMNGKLYDIAYSESTPSSVIYYCINDTEETELFAQFDASLQKQLDTKNDASNPIQKLLKKDIPLGLPEVYVCCQTHFDLSLLNHTTISTQCQRVRSQMHLGTSLPPPKILA